MSRIYIPEILGIAIALLFAAVWVWCVPVLPLTDLPIHLEAAALLRGGNPEMANFITFRPGVLPNQLFYRLVAWLPGSGPQLGAPAAVFFTLALQALAAVAWAPPRRYGLGRFFLLFLLGINFNLMWGFGGFALALPVLALGWYYVSRGKRYARLTALLLTGVVLFFVHLLGFVFWLALLLVGFFFNAYNIKRNWGWALVAIALSVVPLLGWLFGAQGHTSFLVYLSKYFSSEYGALWANRWSQTINVFGWVLPGMYGQWFSGVVLIGGLVLNRPWRGNNSLQRGRIAFMVVAILFFWLLPLAAHQYSIWLLYPRLASWVWFAIWMPGPVSNARTPWRLANGIFALLLAGTMLYAQFSFRPQAQAFSQVFKKVEQSGFTGTLAGIGIDNTHQGRPVWIYIGGYFASLKGVVPITAAYDYQMSRLGRGPKGKNMPHFEEWPDKFMCPNPLPDGFLVRGKPNPKLEKCLQAYHLSWQHQNWRFYQLK